LIKHTPSYPHGIVCGKCFISIRYDVGVEPEGDALQDADTESAKMTE